MCFEYDSKPPIVPIAGAAVDAEDVTLTAADGNQFAAFVARGGEIGSPAIVVLPDVRGLYPFYEELALRFAERGYDALAFDYFGRTAGVGKRDEDFSYPEHVDQATAEGVQADTAASIGYLVSGQPDRPVFTVGFCFGGSNSWHQAANGLALTGAIGFYGNPTRPNRPLNAPPVIDRVNEISCPILGLMGGADQGIPQSDVDALDAALSEAGVEHNIVTYEGAPHSFFDRRYEEFADASADAWERTLAFIEAHR